MLIPVIVPLADLSGGRPAAGRRRPSVRCRDRQDCRTAPADEASIVARRSRIAGQRTAVFFTRSGRVERDDARQL